MSCGVWNNIGRLKNVLLEQGINVQDIFRLVIELGKESMFWYDSWLGSGSLKEKYPSLFELESRKRCNVDDKIGGSTYGWNWKSNPADLGMPESTDHVLMDCPLAIEIRIKISS
uniref:Reverse transcriptase zinc-binding domain-containing protein n=1 Tax=Lactuca sativa TaxID=4236 RepID=A0A9R1WBY7_LACSA|nr:hypothetical protein LSAT_V11C200086640 [Lactuca sativa]